MYVYIFSTIIELTSPEMAHMNGAAAFFTAVGRFCVMFFASAAIGAMFGIVSAIVSFNIAVFLHFLIL